MRFRKLGAFHFRCLDRWESPNLASNLVVVLGRNESGKSTLFELVQVILYGWEHGADARRLYVSWDSVEARCTAELETDSGTPFTVERCIGGRLIGLLVHRDKVVPISNGALPFVAFMPRDVFAELYALSLDRLRMPDRTAWDRLQDQLLGGRYGAPFRALSQVLADLETEANKLWRPDNRGNPLCKQIREQLRRLNSERHEALENERRIRVLEEEFCRIADRAEKLAWRKHTLRATLQELEGLAQIHIQLERAHSLLSEAGDVLAFSDLPQDLREYWERLNATLGALGSKRQMLSEAIARNQDIVESFSQSDAAVLRHEQEIVELCGSKDHLVRLRRELAEQEEATARIRGRVQEQVRAVFGGVWNEELAHHLRNLDERELHNRVQALRQANHQYQSLAAKSKESWLAFVAALFALLVVSLLVRGRGLQHVGWLVAGCGAALALLFAVTRQLRLGRQAAEARRSLDANRKLLAAYLRNLPLDAEKLQNPDEGLLLDIAKLKDTLERLSEAENRSRSVAQALQDIEARAQAIARAMGVPGTHGLKGDVLQVIGALSERLHEARNRQRLAQSARQAIGTLRIELLQVEEEISRLQLEKERFAARLSTVEGDTVQDKIHNLERRRRMYAQAHAILEEIGGANNDLEALRREAARAVRERQELSIELERVEEELVKAQERIAEIRTELSQRQKGLRLDDIEGEMQYLEEKRLAAAARRDRLLLLKRLLELADRQFREEHQPDVLQRASSYLNRITGGRYSRLLAREDGKPGLLVKEAQSHRLIEAGPPLSRGTLEQIFLALRLAMLDHMDAAAERLPLLLDEALVNWDEARMSQGLNLLLEVSQTRQVFFFTCHRWLAQKLCQSSQVQLVELP